MRVTLPPAPEFRRVPSLVLVAIGIAAVGPCQGARWEDKSGVTTTPPHDSTDMVYDAARQETVLVISTGGICETWLWDGTDWLNAMPPNEPTPPRSNFGLGYDAARSRVVLFGGNDRTTTYGDTWEWDGTTWSQVATHVPPPQGPGLRSDLRLAFDGNGVILFGGSHVSHPDDTWRWDGTSWVAVASSGAGPSGRGAHAMTYDGQRVLLFGGANGGCGNFFADTWEWNGSSWALRSSSGPTARQNPAMVWSPSINRVVMFGGQPENGCNYSDETWEWDGTTWKRRFPCASPPGRADHAMGYDRNGRVVVFGGFDGRSGLDDTWVYDDSPSFKQFGSACGGVALAASPGSLPSRGLTFSLAVTGIPVGGSPIHLVILGASKTQWGPVPLPLELTAFGWPGCHLNVSLDTSFAIAVTSPGTATFLLPIPGSLAIGSRAYLQGVVANPAPMGGVSLTNGGEICVGRD